jgi:hypothetical protein
MRYLKLYEEHNSIPDKFIRLDSIGHVLDTEEGILYPALKSGGYDHKNPYEVGWDGWLLDFDGVSDEDMELINKYWLSCKPFIEDKINWDLIQAAKDASLDYLDEGFNLSVIVSVDKTITYNKPGQFGDKFLVYSEIFSHDKIYSDSNYRKLFLNNMRIVKNIEVLSYNFSLEPSRDSRHWGKILSDTRKSNELISLLKDMFPNEIILKENEIFKII